MTVTAHSTGSIKSYGYGILAALVSALLVAAALAQAGTPFVLVAYLVPIPLFMVGMSCGVVSALTASIVGTCGLYAVMPDNFGTFFVVSDALPCAALVALAMYRRPAAKGGTAVWTTEGDLLTASTLYPGLIFLIVYGATLGHGGGLLALTQDAFSGLTDQVAHLLVLDKEPVTPDVTARAQLFLNLLAHIVPALAMCAWVFSTLIAMIAAQWILQRQGWNKRPSFALTHLDVPTWVVFAAAATGLAGAYAPPPYDYLGLNFSLLLGVPFVFVGFAVVHALAAQTKRPILILVLFYIMITLIVHLVLLVAILGAVDQWVGFRKRFAGRPSN